MITPEELSALWKKHAPGLVLLARARCPEVAEDLVQEAFARLAIQVKCPADALAWLARTIRNLAVDHIRGEVRRRKRETGFAESRSWFVENGLDTETRELEGALHRLDSLEREIVIAKVWNGMTFRQIAKLFDMSASSIDRRYRNALSELKRILDEKTEAPSSRAGRSK